MTMSERDLMLPGSCTLDHDGCVVCSDAGIPVRVGEILLTHGGVAIGRVAARAEGDLR